MNLDLVFVENLTYDTLVAWWPAASILPVVRCNAMRTAISRAVVFREV